MAEISKKNVKQPEQQRPGADSDADLYENSKTTSTVVKPKSGAATNSRQKSPNTERKMAANSALVQQKKPTGKENETSKNPSNYI